MNIWNSLLSVKSSSPASFPTSVSNLKLRFSALTSSSLVLSGSNVTQWNDLSGSSRNATKYATSYPTYTASAINNLPAVYFDSGTSLSASLSSGSLSSGVTCFIVFQLSPTSGCYGNVVSRTSGQYGAGFTMSQATRTVDDGAFPPGSPNFSSLNLSSNTDINLMIFSANGSQWKEWVNGASTLSTTFSSAYSDSAGSFYIATRADKNANQYFRGYIGEIVVYSGILSTNDRQTVETYLKRVWNFSYSGLST